MVAPLSMRSLVFVAVPLVGIITAAGCGSARPSEARAPTVPAALVALPETITFQADVAPIRALALSKGYIWIGSERGLRRVRLPGGPAQWVGAESGFVRGGVSALGTDASGRVLIGTDVEVGRFSEVEGAPRYQTVAKLAQVGRLGSVNGPAAGDGLWASTPTGLFFIGGGSINPISAPGGGPWSITSIDADLDGKTAWIGTARQGLFRVDGRQVLAAFGPRAAEPVDFVESLGTALLSNGTRVAAGRGAAGQTRLMLLRAAGPEILISDPKLPELPVLGIIAAQNDTPSRSGVPLLMAGAAAKPRLYDLEASERGGLLEEGAYRFTPLRKGLQSMRIVAHPDARRLPPDITATVRGTHATDAVDGVFVGTLSMGVAKLAGEGPAHLPGGELALGARGLSVACLEQERCVFATGAGPGWIWDGGDHPMKPIPQGAIGGDLMALAGDGRSTVYFVAAGAGKALRIARLSSDGARWDPFMTLPVQVEGVPIITFATLSPLGSMWMAVRDRAPTGQESGRGVIELQLSASRAIHHRPDRRGEAREPDALPIAGDVAAVRFRGGHGSTDPEATWFCTSLGILRFAEGQLSHWGENDGLDSETCHDLEIAVDGGVWVATEKGVARFDGKSWRRVGGVVTGRLPPEIRWPPDRDGDGAAARALVLSGRVLWAGTSRGLWPLAPGIGPINRTNGLVDDDVIKLASDRFGRIWALGQVGVTIRRPF